jgi:saccharopine dehydrogenase (NADP+, L-glutamate forming)
MSTIHWLGAGLSSAPGIARLAGAANPLVLWNRTVSRAQAVVANLDTAPEVRELDFKTLANSTQAGDVLVSMLPASFHCQVAEIALARGAHFVSSSYIDEPMRGLHARAQASGLALVNEVGLDPGLDHLMAHALVDAFRETQWASHSDIKLQFRSYCGGFPATANDFRYKFSWSPVGVLRALKTPARCIKRGQVLDVARPWHAIETYSASLPVQVEDFQAYPNRDSLPFVAQYNFPEHWQLDEFVRGTLRLPGWSTAWEPLFNELEQLEGERGEQRLADISQQLWQQYAYDEGEADRVVLCVELAALQGDTTCWHQSFAIDARGNEQGSAMARLVSIPVSLAVESVLAGDIAPGVSAAPERNALITQWFTTLANQGDQVLLRDHLATA